MSGSINPERDNNREKTFLKGPSVTEGLTERPRPVRKTERERQVRLRGSKVGCARHRQSRLNHNSQQSKVIKYVNKQERNEEAERQVHMFRRKYYSCFLKALQTMFILTLFSQDKLFGTYHLKIHLAMFGPNI